MKKTFLLVVAAMFAVNGFSQETKQFIRIWTGDKVYVHKNIAEIDSITFVEVTSEEVTPGSSTYQPKAFTINSNGDQVFFSQGNLQYQASSDTWRFAENQYDVIGSANSNASNTYEGWIDLFGWGTSGYDNTANDPFAVNYQPWSTSNSSINTSYYAHGQEIESINCEMEHIIGKCDTVWSTDGFYSSNDVNTYGYGPSTFWEDKNLSGSNANYDWGVYNAISNGGNQAGMWRTLTYEEWDYIRTGRNLAQYLCARATVCDVHGFVLLPDNFSLPTGLSWSVQPNGWDTNIYDAQAWSAMEATGAVFLPAAGYRYGTDVVDVGSYGGYWSASCYYSQDDARYMYFNSRNADMYGDNRRSTRDGGQSVRLVRQAE